MSYVIVLKQQGHTQPQKYKQRTVACTGRRRAKMCKNGTLCVAERMPHPHTDWFVVNNVIIHQSWVKNVTSVSSGHQHYIIYDSNGVPTYVGGDLPVQWLSCGSRPLSGNDFITWKIQLTERTCLSIIICMKRTLLECNADSRHDPKYWYNMWKSHVIPSVTPTCVACGGELEKMPVCNRYVSKLMCNECEKTSVMCYRCDSVESKDNAHYIYNKENAVPVPYCRVCFEEVDTETCVHCGVSFLSNIGVVWVDRRHKVHRVCSKDCVIAMSKDTGNLMQCGSCEHYYIRGTRGSGIFPDGMARGLCHHCYKIELERPLKRYSFKPAPIFHYAPDEPPSTPCYGVELEIEPENDDINVERFAARWQKKHRWIYCKPDSSLGAGGVEIVTHPTSLRWLKEHDKKLEDLLEIDSWYTTARCGIHIHIGRDRFSALHLFKFMSFIHSANNSKSKLTNQDFVISIAGRPSQHYSSLSFDDDSYDDIYRNSGHEVVRRVKSHYCSRYTAVNLNTKDRATVEIRIFKATLNKSVFMKNIEFIDALYYFTQNIPRKLNTYKSFIAFVEEHHSKYSNLYQFLKASGWFNR